MMGEGQARDVRALQGKFTFIGAQKKSIPTLVFTTFYHLARMDWFLPLRGGGRDYANDDRVVWHFTTSPDEAKSIVASLVTLGEVLERSEPSRSPALSLTMVLGESRLGNLAFEAILDRDAAKAALAAVHDALDRSNGLARTVMELHRQAIYGPDE